MQMLCHHPPLFNLGNNEWTPKEHLDIQQDERGK
jgi:hypothetical protein